MQPFNAPVGPVIALVRHGDYHQPADVPSALLPYPLTEKGRAQARACAELITEFCARRGLQVQASVDCSRQLRAFETAQLIAQTLAGEFVVNEHEVLAERSVGAMANLTVQAIEAIVEADPRYETLPVGWKSSSDYCLPFMGAESLRDAGERVTGHLLQAWQKLAPGELKVIVGHGASMRHAAARLGIMPESDIPRLSMHHARPVFVSRDEQGTWLRVAGEWKVRQRAGDEYGE